MGFWLATIPKKSTTRLALFDYIPESSPLKKWVTHRNAYLLGLATILCGLAWSNILMSIGQLILVGNWLAELEFEQKRRRAINQPILFLMLLFFALHLVGFAWSEDLDYAVKDATVKLPLLVLPLIIGTTKVLRKKEWYFLFSVYIITLTVLSVISLLKYLGLTSSIVMDKRDLSIYISHIRYGLNICLGIVFLLFQSVDFVPRVKGIRLLLILWFTACLILFQFYTALLILLILGVFFFISGLMSKKKLSSLFMVVSACLTMALIVGCILVFKVYQDYHKPVPLDYNQESFFPARSAGGEVYGWRGNMYVKENGVYLNRYVAWNELEESWSKRSNLRFWKKDLKGQSLTKTLLRYMSSKGLKKDSMGVSQLTDEDITAIERGVANVYYTKHWPIENRIHQTFDEFEKYRESGTANSFSLALRLVYWKAALDIIREDVLFGKGTGDVKQAFKNYYKTQNIDLEERYRRRAHNQYLSIGVAFGLLGMAFFMVYLLLPLTSIFKKNRVFTAFWLLACLSFLTEDTLETQAGVTLFIVFWSLFSFALNPFYFRSS
ncbi:MAG: hypothetical protein CMO34_05920 [Verrucomicrobia bacterium]|nr:hypothetical protein [Verrucomicrobiota bacterium]